MIERPNILVAPLDWGLGHATRCIPLITQLIQHNCRVIIAANGPQSKVLQEAFPDLPMLALDGYGVKYSRNGVWWKILSQVPDIIRKVSQEHQWLQQMVKQHQIHLVISDNRYGLWSPHCKSILMTHQLAPALPKNVQWAAGMLRNMMYQQVEKFTECWVPDTANEKESLSGRLGHPGKLPKVPVHFIGWLTRFKPQPISESNIAYKLLIILSGPEPQRTLLEQILFEQIPFIKQPLLVVRGLPGETIIPVVAETVTVVNHLPTSALQKAMEQSEYVLARGGYSTLMDAFTLQKKCIFIPTPGQTEQEYLCQKLQQQKAALCFSQSHFQLQDALQQADTFSFQLPNASANNDLAAFVKDAIHRLIM